MIEVASHHTSVGEVFYTGIDLFEAHPVEHGPPIALKAAHRMFRATGAKVRLLPGDPLTVLSRAANQLGIADLVIVSAGFDAKVLATAWFYLPRILHPDSQVFVELTQKGSDDRQMRRLSFARVQALADKASQRRRAA